MFQIYTWLVIGRIMHCPLPQIRRKYQGYICRSENKLLAHGLAAWRASTLKAIWQRNAVESAASSFENRVLLRFCKAWRSLARCKAWHAAFVQSARARRQKDRLAEIVAAWRALTARHASLSRAVARMAVLRKARMSAAILTAWCGYAAAKVKLRQKLLVLQKGISLHCSAEAWRAWASYTTCTRAKQGVLAKHRARRQSLIARHGLQQWHARAAERRHLQDVYNQIFNGTTQSFKRSHLFSWWQFAKSMQIRRSQIKARPCFPSISACYRLLRKPDFWHSILEIIGINTLHVMLVT